jgi:uncharacterized membrane protein YtjA (UPF0391 family)
LTGFFPSRPVRRFRRRRRILFLRPPQFLRFPRPEPRGTFVPEPDYSRNRCAAILAALMSKQEKWKTEVLTMLSWVVTFLVIALIAGILGFGGVAGASIEIAKIIFFVAVVLFLVSSVVGLARGRTRV